jgi:hypothetical protein
MKKFLICLLVVAIALLGFTGCPSPASDDSGGDSGPVDSVDDYVPALDDLRELTHTALGYATGYTTLTAPRVVTIFAIVDDIELAEYGWRPQGNFPAVRAAENYADYDYYDEINDVQGYVYKATNYPVYHAEYLEEIQNWARILPDGDLAPGDTLDRTFARHVSREWPEVILKSGGKDDILALATAGSTFSVLQSGPYYGTEVDVVIDGKAVYFEDAAYTNEYTKISERLTGVVSHVDSYFTREGDYSYTVERAYSIDTGVNYDVTGTPTYGNEPGAFKIWYKLTTEGTETVDSVDLMIEDDSLPLYPVKPPAEITSADFGNPIGFIIDLEIRGRKATAAAPYIGGEETLLALHIETWKDLIDASQKGTFARTGTTTGAVNTSVIDWILGPAPELPGAPVDTLGTGFNVVYDGFAHLPAAVQAAILAASPIL